MQVLVWKLKVRYRPGTDPDPDPIRIQGLMTKNWRKNYSLKINLFGSKIAINLCPCYRRSLQPSKKNIEHFKKLNLLSFFYVCGSFLPSLIWIRSVLRIRIRIQGPHWIRIQSGSGSTTLSKVRNPNYLINDTFVMSWGILSRAWVERLESTASSCAGLRASPASGSRSTSAASSADSREDNSANTWKATKLLVSPVLLRLAR